MSSSIYSSCRKAIGNIPTAVLLIGALFVSGCSGSSDSGSNLEDNPSINQDIENSGNLDGGSVDNTNNGTGSTGVTQAQIAGEISDDASTDISGSVPDPISPSTEVSDESVTNITNATEQELVNTDSVIPDPMVQNRTQVNFEITVPTYQSNALQVRLTWGDVQASAEWIGDELWSAALDFPSDTERLLTIVFSDDNGNIVLGSHEQTYRTGFSDTEVFQVSADQFDTNRWDTDEDGTSNIDELLVGSDPLTDETTILEVRDSYIAGSINPVSSYYEQSISDERPYSYQLEELPPIDASFYTDRRTHIVSIEIDESGNGAISDSFQYRGAADRDITIENQEGIRTNTGDSILWIGTYNRSNSGAAVSDDIIFSIETRSSDDMTMKQDGTIRRQNSGMSNGSYEQEIFYSLVGTHLDDSTMCRPISGNITNGLSFTAFANGRPDTVTTVSKDSDDLYWSVVVVSPEGDILENYLARSLIADFYCEMGDL